MKQNKLLVILAEKFIGKGVQKAKINVRLLSKEKPSIEKELYAELDTTPLLSCNKHR